MHALPEGERKAEKLAPTGPLGRPFSQAPEVRYLRQNAPQKAQPKKESFQVTIATPTHAPLLTPVHASGTGSGRFSFSVFTAPKTPKTKAHEPPQLEADEPPQLG